MGVEILIAYDVETVDAKGKRRLRKVAQACQAYGQRVQNSVFECIVNDVQYERLLNRVLEIMDREKDSLRVYRLREPKGEHVEVYGKKPEFALDDALII